MTTSITPETQAINSTSVQTDPTTINKSNVGVIFFLLVTATYLIFVAISDSMKILNDRLQLLQSELQQAIKIQGYMTNTLTTKKSVDGKDYVVLGGPDTDGGAASRATEIRLYLISIKIDTKGIPIAPPAPTLELTFFTSLSNSVNSDVDLTRQTAQTESAKASSVQSSANAALELATSILKTLTSALLSIAQNTPR